MIDRHIFRDHRLDAAMQTCDRRAIERSYHPSDEPNGKTAAIALVSIVMGLGVLGFFGLAIVRGIW